jgi:hypothetical protein
VVDVNINYSKDIKKCFEKLESHEAVKQTNTLSNEFGFSFDAPVTFMLMHTQPTELKQIFENSKYLADRAGGIENLKKYETALVEFSKDSAFASFWNSKIPFYNKIIEFTAKEIDTADLVSALENYYGETQNSYNIIIAPAFRGGYGPSLKAPNGKNDIYSCNSATDEKEGIPYLSMRNLIGYVWHEFSHSFVNYLTYQNSDRVKSFEKLFDPIEKSMGKMAYGKWSICVNEHIVRAVNIRLAELNLGYKAGADIMTEEKEKDFIYIEPIIEKLKEFEKLRKENNITFSQFYPKLLDVFDELLKKKG